MISHHHSRIATNSKPSRRNKHLSRRRAEITQQWASQPASYVPSATIRLRLPRHETNNPQLGGFTLTTTILYLSLNLHARNRLHQSALLHQQAQLLTSIVEPAPLAPQPIDRRVQQGLLETAKDR